MRRLFLLLAFLLGTSAVSNTVTAQSYAVTVWNQLQATYDLLADSQEYQLVNYIVGKLGDSESDSWSFPLVAGREYFLMAACDEDCSDVDLDVSTGGNSIASDTATDDIPVLTFVARESGLHVINVKMYECSSEPCFWGLGLFEK
jgi:hypothetical protein